MREKYKLIAFITLFKFRRDNSIIYKHDSHLLLAKELGIAYNTFKKYLKLCKELGLINTYGSHLQFIKLTKAIKILNIQITKHNRFYKYVDYNNITFKNIYTKIVSSIILNNYKQQQYNISKKEYKIGILMSKGNSNLSGKGYSTLIKLKKEGSSLKSMQTQTIHKIVTGKNHVANLIGYSSTSGSNWLKALVANKCVERKVIKTYLDYPFNNNSFDIIKLQNFSGIVTPVTSLRKFVHYKGSEVEIL